jgi:hypothetical protein
MSESICKQLYEISDKVFDLYVFSVILERNEVNFSTK